MSYVHEKYEQSQGGTTKAVVAMLCKMKIFHYYSILFKLFLRRTFC